MGVDLCQYGNHKITFSGREVKEIVDEIRNKFNSLKLIKYLALKGEVCCSPVVVALRGLIPF